MRKLIHTACCILLCNLLCAQHVTDHRANWTQLARTNARDISITNKGDLYYVNTNGLLSVYGLEGWTQSGDEKVKTYSEFTDWSGTLAVKLLTNGKMLTRKHSYDSKTKTHSVSWDPMPGSDAQDLAVTYYFKPRTVTPSSEVYMVNTAGKIYVLGRYVNVDWSQLPGSDAARISAAKGEVWIVNTVGKIYRLIPLSRGNQDKWEQVQGPGARDIALAEDGSKWLAGTDGKLYKWLGNTWAEQAGVNNAARVAANSGKVVYSTTDGKMFLNYY